MASLLPNATQYATLVAADPDFRAVLWSRIFTQTFKYRSKWRHFSGPEDSGMPITKKTDLEAGIAQDVVFNMVSPIGGQGVVGATQLRTVTRAIKEHSFRVRVDANRQGIAYNQLINWLRKDLNPEQKAVELLSDWAVRKYDDDIMVVLWRYARATDPSNNLVRTNGSTQTLLKTASYLSPSIIEQSKARLMAIGANPIATDLVESGSVCPQYLLYAPDTLIRPLRTNSTFLATLQYGDVRGKDNALFSGHYPLWDNNVIYADEMGSTDVDGRQGTPLMPLAFLGTAITDATTTTLTGGGTTDPASTGDYFAYFPGYPWYITSTDTLPTESGTFYALIYNNSGASANSYEIVSYLSSGFAGDGSSLTVTRIGSGDGKGNGRANTASRFTTSHPSGSVIIPCTDQGVPLSWGIHCGSDALRYAIGNVENQRADQLDDFGMDQGIATNTVRGLSVFTDRRNIAKNFVVIEGSCVHPLLAQQPETYA